MNPTWFLTMSIIIWYERVHFNQLRIRPTALKTSVSLSCNSHNIGLMACPLPIPSNTWRTSIRLFFPSSPISSRSDGGFQASNCRLPPRPPPNLYLLSNGELGSSSWCLIINAGQWPYLSITLEQPGNGMINYEISRGVLLVIDLTTSRLTIKKLRKRN